MSKVRPWLDGREEYIVMPELASSASSPYWCWSIAHVNRSTPLIGLGPDVSLLELPLPFEFGVM